MQVAQTILNQLGGIGKLRLMIGMNQVVVSDDSVKFSFKGSKKSNMCKIKLLPSDTYSIQFYKFTKKNLSFDTVNEYNDVYCDQLIELFEESTGLLLSL